MDEEVFERTPYESPAKISLCGCLLDQGSSESTAAVIPERKRLVLTAVSRTENYLRERRIPELVRYLLSKMLVDRSNKPVLYLDELVNKCMLFRAGFGPAPVLFEKEHVEAVVKSFDPGKRGWLTSGQTRRAFITMGLPPPDNLDDRVPCEEVLNSLIKTQEAELFDLLTAGMEKTDYTESSKSASSDT